MRFDLNELSVSLSGELIAPCRSGKAGTERVEGVSIDSRTIQPGQLFVPLVAERDGHDFIASAVTAGATATLTSRGDAHKLAAQHESVSVIAVADTFAALKTIGRLSRQNLPGPLIGITGSVAKTSVKDMTFAACSKAYKTWASDRSFNNEIGVPLTLANAAVDTEVLVVEMGARGIGHIAELCELAAPNIGLVTTVALAHSEMFGSVHGVAKAKAELVESLPRDGVAVLNADNPLVLAMASKTEAEILTFGSVPDAEVRVSSLELDRFLRPHFKLHVGHESFDVMLEVRGAHMALNAAAAVAAAISAGVPATLAVEGLADTALSPWRMEVEETPSGLIVINDAYNANPTSMRAGLEALCAIKADRRIAVVGSMAELGAESLEQHQAIAAEAVNAGVMVIAVAAQEYGDQAEHVADIDTALELLKSFDQKKNAVLIKGSRVAALERLASKLITG